MFKKGMLFGLVSLSMIVGTSAFGATFKLNADFDGDNQVDTISFDIPKTGGKMTISTSFATASKAKFSRKVTNYLGMYAVDLNNDSISEIVSVREDGNKYRVLAWNGLGQKVASYKISGKIFKKIKQASASSFKFPEISGLNGVCPNTRGFSSGEIWKVEASDHIPSSDPRKYSTSFIYLAGKSPSSFSCLSVYDKHGNKLHELGLYAKGESSYAARFYGGHGCGDGATGSSIASKAQKATGSKEGYLKVSNSMCLRIPDLSKRED